VLVSRPWQCGVKVSEWVVDNNKRQLQCFSQMILVFLFHQAVWVLRLRHVVVCLLLCFDAVLLMTAALLLSLNAVAQVQQQQVVHVCVQTIVLAIENNMRVSVSILLLYSSRYYYEVLLVTLL
jgi:hypothetical protein